MARIIVHEEKAPAEIKTGSESRWIFMCGLSKNRPFCYGSHAKVQNEENGKLYAYSKDGTGVEIKE
ncbi:MAG: CDGSH iron-sulfur domain-containing protein [Candidatus Aenigmarchaeota archaeon]|nr:CDGSH iron-sulfur domain-containing protein [Candidatus Aenigmarchaeota archaeon]